MKQPSSGASLFHILSPLPLLEYLQSSYTGIHSIETEGFCLGIAGCRVVFPPGQHAHSDFEFLMPLNDTVQTVCDGKMLQIEKQKMMPFNSGQNHGPGDATQEIDGFIGITCDQLNLISIVEAMFGKDRIWFENEAFVVSNQMRLLISLLMEEEHGKQKGAEFLKENLAHMIMAHILRSAKSDIITKPALIGNESQKITRTAEYLREQYDMDFSLTEVAAQAGLSPYHFIRIFKKHTGKTPYEYLLDVKIEKAKELLSDKSQSVTEVCLNSGFNNSSHFSAVFKRKTGMSPIEYRRIIQNI